MIGASPAQRGLLYALAKQVGEAHVHVKDRAAAIGLMSIADMTSDQAAYLIRTYQYLIRPPAPATPTRANFFGLPKRVTPKPAVQPFRPFTPAAAAPIKPTGKQPVGIYKWDPDLKIATGGVEDIPW